MPLADWLGRSRGEGFVEHLEYAAEELGLDGGVVRGVGIYHVPWRGVRYVVTVCLEEGGAVVRSFGNTRFPPAGPPPEVAAALLRWKTSAPYLLWDGHGNQDWSCFLIRCRIALASFSAKLLASSIDESLGEVAALDKLLADSGFGRLGEPGTTRPDPPRLEAPRGGLLPIRRVADAATRLLRGW